MGQETTMGNGFSRAPASSRNPTGAPDAGASAAARFIAEHEETRQALAREQADNQSLRMQLQDLMRENQLLRDHGAQVSAEYAKKLKTAEDRVFFLQGYAVEITTCLKITGSMIDRAIQKAQENGIAVATAPREEQSREPIQAEPERQETVAVGGRLPIVSPMSQVGH